MSAPAPLLRTPRADTFAVALAHQQAGDLQKAERLYRRILAKDPHHVNALHLYGLLFHARGKTDEAIAYIRKAISLYPAAPMMYLNLGVILESKQLYTEAIAMYKRALRLNPGFWEAWFNYGNVYSALALHSESVQCFRKAAELQPDLETIQSNMIFQLDASDSSTAEERLAARVAWGKAFAASEIEPHGNNLDPDRKIRVGYVSGDLRAHSAWLAISPIILGHDRSRFDVYLYCSNVSQDGATKILQESETTWRDVVTLDDNALAAQIRADAIDILVDLSAFTANNRLRVFGLKPAPIQVTAWGYAGGTGLPTMDYAFADETTVPESARGEFVEEVVYLPSLIAYNEPANATDVGALPATLIDGMVTFGSFNRPTKYTQKTLDLWARVLNAVPNSRLMLKHGGLIHTYSEQRIREAFEDAGIVTDRVRLFGYSHHAEHLDSFNDVDIQLDPTPQNGGVTTLEGMWMGVPTLTLYGDRLSGRTSASYMQRVGHPEYIAMTEDEYVQKAVEFAADLTRLATVRAGLRGRLKNSVMCQHAPYVVEVEMAYQRMWHRYCEQRRGEVAA